MFGLRGIIGVSFACFILQQSNSSLPTKNARLADVHFPVHHDQESPLHFCLSVRGGSSRYQEDVELVPSQEFRGLFGLGRTDENGRPIPSDSPLYDQGPEVEFEEDEDFSDEPGVEDKGVPISIILEARIHCGSSNSERQQCARSGLSSPQLI